MSHTLASRCTVCGAVDDTPCPECRTSSARTHGVADQRPFTSDLVYTDGTRHEWHPGCLTTSIAPVTTGAMGVV